ncbi:craniofacial development protein 2-like [Amphiura filiformis]|uniref:craniofacial development protein 2-like n=1 Tax=Amphiura filiformis TaxID=82378 RepID=UPI003B20F568
MNISAVQAYTPTSTSTDEEITTFYDDLQKAIDDINKRDMTVATGDFNAKVGGKSTNSNVMGNFGLGELNERGEILVEFCQENLKSNYPKYLLQATSKEAIHKVITRSYYREPNRLHPGPEEMAI